MTMFGLCQFHCYLTRGCEYGHLSLPLCVQGRGRKKDGCLSQSRAQQFTHGAALWKACCFDGDHLGLRRQFHSPRVTCEAQTSNLLACLGHIYWVEIVWGHIYVGRSKRNASYFFPWKRQQIERAEEHYLIVQILIYKALFFNRVSTISYAFLLVMNII